MRECEVAIYRSAWSQAKGHPRVAGPDSFIYQMVGRYVRELACQATRPFPVPVNITAEVSGISPRYVGMCLGELVRHGVVRVVQPGGPGRYTRYEYCRQYPSRLAG